LHFLDADWERNGKESTGASDIESKLSDLDERSDTDSSSDILPNEREGVFRYDQIDEIPEELKEFDPAKGSSILFRDSVGERGGHRDLDPQNNSYDVGGAASELWSVSKNNLYDMVDNEGAGMKEEFGRTMFSCINGNGIFYTSPLIPCLHRSLSTATVDLGLGNRTDGPLIGGGFGVTLRQDSGSFGVGIELAALA
jgi:hypothetical protein